MKRCYITRTNCITPLGNSVAKNWLAIQSGQSGIKKHSKFGMLKGFYAAIIPDHFVDQTIEVTSKIERILIQVLQPILDVNKITEKTALIFSTTKGDIIQLKDPLNNINNAFLSTLAKKTADFFGFQTEPIVVSNACVSGILAISVAKRLIQGGLYDNAYIVAADEVTEFVLSGFNSFQAMSDLPCKPYDAHRTGVTLGEAAAAVYMTSLKEEVQTNDFEVLGEGAINDANHISGPSRTGEGLYRSIASALKEAAIINSSVDLISAHGTATPYNDEMEAIAFNRLGLQNKPINSLKGYYGHTLGASGLLETVMTLESAKHNILIVSKGYETCGVSQPINIISEPLEMPVDIILKTASGFGGCNTAVVFKKIK
ncbi:beta-ketoacyl-[acyl-carrier-protein] synthase family protein [Flavobacterium oreochromis]|uniref:Nodulation protein E n=2 Tax=Flavobacterium TaxID=237 RepID=A0A246GCY6_9FLAO|nr:beta-ketoacyl synthase N-terminal-like domain-containing protein [Flavobacterium oreochromis]OWP77367.1 beta-ketoacyl synthase [Flavobacterium oreochromis]OWP79187.1 beta-ketoacyl synthase [Flavobacterium oreochromis]POR28328.1 beta-ketoacyl synthase [Flavobacterium columnare]